VSDLEEVPHNMSQPRDGRIQVSRNFAVGVATVIIALAIATAYLIGMVISGNGDGESAAIISPTPAVLASEQDEGNAGDTPTQATAPALQGASKSTYGTCLARTWRALSLDAKDTEFKPWEDRTTTKEVWPIIELRHVDYIAEHCRHLAPAPPASSSVTCIPKELQSFYRRHIPEGTNSQSHQAIAAQYALTVCQPSAER